MKKFKLPIWPLLFVCALAFSHCKDKETCDDAIMNQDETGVDCGGVCDACATCTDGIRNQNETGVDCGGPCPNVCSIISNLRQYNTANSDIPSDNVREMWWDGTSLWLATDAGVGVLTNETWVVYNTSNSMLPSDDVRDFWQANDGSMWMTTANGVARLNAGTWTIYNSANGAPAQVDNAEHIAQTLNWTIVTTPGTGFLIWDTFGWTSYTTSNSSLPTGNLTDVEAELFDAYFASSDMGIVTFKNLSFATLNTSNSPLPSDAVNSLILTGDSDLWIGSGNGLSLKTSADVWDTRNASNSPILSANVDVLTRDQYGEVWVNAGGLAHYIPTGNTWTIYTDANSSPMLSAATALHVESGTQAKWVGTAGHGLLVFN